MFEIDMAKIARCKPGIKGDTCENGTVGRRSGCRAESCLNGTYSSQNVALTSGDMTVAIAVTARRVRATLKQVNVRVASVHNAGDRLQLVKQV